MVVFMNAIQLNQPLNTRDAAIVARANQLKEKAQSVLADLNTPSDHVQLNAKDSNERLGAFTYDGKIGQDGFAKVYTSSFEDGKLRGFSAQQPASKADETLVFSLDRSEAEGVRAGVASALGGVAGGMGSAYAWLLAKAITTAPRHEITGKALEIASRPFGFGHDLFNWAKDKVSDPGTKDERYQLSGPGNKLECYVFTAQGTLEHNQP